MRRKRRKIQEGCEVESLSDGQLERKNDGERVENEGCEVEGLGDLGGRRENGR